MNAASYAAHYFDGLAEFAFFAVLAGWLGFFLILVLGKRAAAPGAAKRAPVSAIGFFLQLVGYGICFVFRRAFFTPIAHMHESGEAILTLFIAALVIASVWLCWAAARALGKQWALAARVIEGHELIVAGPFAAVRNPIYLAMLGMLIAWALAVARWQAILPALILFLAGTVIRIRSEEKLLRETFGPEFDDYARRVPAMVPRLFKG